MQIAAPFLACLALLLNVGRASVKVDVRCYCNLSACLATGHMCRSSARVCLSESHSDGVTWRYACVEQFSHQVSPQEYCAGNVTRRCCEEDMCNYPKKISVPSNHSHVRGHPSGDSTPSRGGRLRRSPWFFVAVVVVPALGVSVLLVLVFAATKMLRSAHTDTSCGVGKSGARRDADRNKTRPLRKSLSCVVLDGSGASAAVRTFASVGRLHPSAYSLDKGVSVNFSASSDSSRNQYFVFDV